MHWGNFLWRMYSVGSLILFGEKMQIIEFSDGDESNVWMLNMRRSLYTTACLSTVFVYEVFLVLTVTTSSYSGDARVRRMCEE